MQTRKMRSMNTGFLYDKKGKNASMSRLADAGGVSKSYQTAFIVTVREKNAGAGNLIWRMIICMGIGQGFFPAKTA